jgi:hypothetical protein
MFTLIKQSSIFVFILFFFNFSLQAQNYQIDGNYFLRNSTNFLALNNIVGVLNQASTFRVINYYPEKNGAEIEITSMTPGSYVKSDYVGSLFIYMGNKKNFIKRSNDEVSSSEAGTASCVDCQAKPQSGVVAAISNRHHLGEISNGILVLANEAPKQAPRAATDPKDNELVSPPAQGSLDARIKNYSDSTQVKRMIDWAMKNKRSASTGICYRKVKEAMATQCGPPRTNYLCKNPFHPEGGKQGPGNNFTKSISTDIHDFAAASAKERLKQSGFVNLLEIEPYKFQMKSPSYAPQGAILVYSSGIPCSVKDKKGRVVASTNDCGHTEIKVGRAGQPGYVSDFYLDDAINETPRARKYGSNYKLIGIMIKPMDNK